MEIFDIRSGSEHQAGGLGEHLAHVLSGGFGIVAFVFMMMALIQLLTARVTDRHLPPWLGGPWAQVVFGSLLGALPGCFGSFLAVSLYAKGMLNLPAVVAMMVSTSGDEAFVMLSMLPGKALLLMGLLLLVSIAFGWVLLALGAHRWEMPISAEHLQEGNDSNPSQPASAGRWQKPAILLAVLASGLYAGLGGIGHDHGQGHGGIERWIFVGAAVVLAAVVWSSPSELVYRKVWRKVVLRSLPSVVLWTLGALAVTELLAHYVDVDAWVGKNIWLVLVLASLVGLIPTSGPHLVFFTLYLSGALPFSVLLANSAVQDGHGSIPLLAFSRKAFVWMKLISLAIGLLIGAVALAMGY